MKLDRKFSIICDNLIDTVKVQEYLISMGEDEFKMAQNYLFSIGYRWVDSGVAIIENDYDNYPVMICNYVREMKFGFGLYNKEEDILKGDIYDGKIFLRKAKLERLYEER